MSFRKIPKKYKIDISKKFEVAKDYHFTNLSFEEIAEKHGIHRNTVFHWKNIFSRQKVKELKGKREVVVLIDYNDFEKAVEVLAQLGFVFRMPSKQHVLEESYDSKMNFPEDNVDAKAS